MFTPYSAIPNSPIRNSKSAIPGQVVGSLAASGTLWRHDPDKLVAAVRRFRDVFYDFHRNTA